MILIVVAGGAAPETSSDTSMGRWRRRWSTASVVGSANFKIKPPTLWIYALSSSGCVDELGRFDQVQRTRLVGEKRQGHSQFHTYIAMNGERARLSLDMLGRPTDGLGGGLAEWQDIRLINGPVSVTDSILQPPRKEIPI